MCTVKCCSVAYYTECHFAECEHNDSNHDSKMYIVKSCSYIILSVILLNFVATREHVCKVNKLIFHFIVRVVRFCQKKFLNA